MDLRPQWREDRQHWQVTVPSSLAGKRLRMAFSDKRKAEEWIAEKALAATRGQLSRVAIRSGSTEGLTVSGLAALYVAEKSHLDPVALRVLKNRLGKLTSEEGSREAVKLDALETRRWLERLPLSQRTRHAVFAEARAMYAWGMRYRIIERNPFQEMEPLRKGHGEKHVLQPAQMRLLLAYEWPEYFRTWLALGGFAGLRTVEIFRLDWSAVTRAEIFVGADVIKKTRGLRSRYVRVLPTLLRHLPRKKSGPVIPVFRNAFAAQLRKATKLLELDTWPHNCLRHSFASYHLARWQDAARTAHEMGHTSTRMVHDEYARAVSRQAASQWWKL